MTEDVTANIRLSVTVALLAGLISACTVMAITSLKYFDKFMISYTTAISDAGTSALSDLNKSSKVSAPLLYRMLCEDNGKVKTLKISYVNGDVTSDYNTLLNHAGSFMSVDVTQINGAYIVVVEEVD